ncbi:alpha/beta hydrolase [Arthrobacter gengyunqii]|uniref:Alpha/beta hydrolase n=1 Tax=Arthrobacter gengyunqii TaxID=2886940 RepID=A0A9X1M311_9MICC|nr:alpha/beta hydrolase [Arthrobacter gengyunqii]MCC3270429.1 alpha/beta hydrolase [Arthrobacter gengyunqii]UOY97618.1 alpha/beta hydrolase [Arthrobacter gengyunqii]
MSPDMVLRRNNVRVLGRSDGPALVLVQGFGCDQVIWDRILPEFTDAYKVVLLDHVGTGGAVSAAYDPDKYSSLTGYLGDLLEVLDALELENATVVGHSVAGMMALAASVESRRIGRLVLLCATACYLNHDGYEGGFEPENVEDVLRAIEANYPLWAAAAAPGITGTEPGSGLSADLAERMCRLRPEYVRDFLQMSFAADVRPLLERVSAPALILQTLADPLTPEAASSYLHEHLPGSTLMPLDIRGNMPHLNAPRQTASAILAYIESDPRG